MQKNVKLGMRTGSHINMMISPKHTNIGIKKVENWGFQKGVNGRNQVPSYSPKSEHQKKYVTALENNDISLVFALGPAGTGKTLFACIKAIQDLRAGTINKIVLTRPVVTVEEDIGFLPGDIQHKMDPWTRPIFDIFLEYYSQRELDEMIAANVIEIAPLAFMRGRTFKRCFLIADEMQNSSPNQMLMLTTRIGSNSKMVITGDLCQSDRLENNGLRIFVDKYRDYVLGGGKGVGIEVCEMTMGDIERSAIVAKILDIFATPTNATTPTPPPTPKPPTPKPPTGGDIEEHRVIGGDYSGVSPGSATSWPPSNQSGDAAIIPEKDYYTKNKPIW